MKQFINPWHARSNAGSHTHFTANEKPIMYRGHEIHGQAASVIVVIDGAVVTQRVTVHNAQQYIDRYVDGTMENWELESLRKCQEKAKQ